MGKSPPNAEGTDLSAFVVDSVVNHPAPPNEATAIITLTAASQSQEQEQAVHQEDVEQAQDGESINNNNDNNIKEDPFSQLPIHRPRFHPVCDKIIILYGAIMAHKAK
jgi:hypothetical protein